jgi:L-cysteine S-thiosulfotransferase
LACIALPAFAQQDTRKSGYDFMGPDTQAMQKDDLANPGMLFVLEGPSLWNAPAGKAQKSCASCHGEAAQSMKGVAARYPAFDDKSQKPLDLAGRIIQCRVERQEAIAPQREGKELLALTAFVGHQSRGLPVAPPQDERLASTRAEGAKLYTARMGQLNFSCAQCHDDNAGGHLGAAPIPQAHPTGYPLYRLEWQALGSLQRRFRNCMSGMRAEPFTAGSSEAIALELFLMDRAVGMRLETPAVRP